MAADALEVEFKLALPGEAARARLLARLGADPAQVPVVQENHFFDTRSRALARGRSGLRLRSAGTARTLTLKGPPQATPVTPGAGALHARAEEELELAPDEAQAVLAGTLDPLVLFRARRPGSALARRAHELVGGQALLHLGSFRNERLAIASERLAGLVLELDRTHFPGGHVEHELELELPDAAAAPAVEAALRALLAEVGVPWTPARGKAERLFEHLGAGP